MTTITRGWPPQRRSEQAARIRRHKPWRFSTGPKTVAGRAISAQNGMKHGYRSRHYSEVCRLLRTQRLFVRAVRQCFSLPRLPTLSSLMPRPRPPRRTVTSTSRCHPREGGDPGPLTTR
jgi:hypothetical protein